MGLAPLLLLPFKLLSCQSVFTGNKAREGQKTCRGVRMRTRAQGQKKSSIFSCAVVIKLKTGEDRRLTMEQFLIEKLDQSRCCPLINGQCVKGNMDTAPASSTGSVPEERQQSSVTLTAPENTINSVSLCVCVCGHCVFTEVFTLGK